MNKRKFNKSVDKIQDVTKELDAMTNELKNAKNGKVYCKKCHTEMALIEWSARKRLCALCSLKEELER